MLIQNSDIFKQVESTLIRCVLIIPNRKYKFVCAFTVNSLHISHFDMHALTVSLSRQNILTAYKYPIGAPA